MRRFQMRRIGRNVGVDLEHDDAGRIALVTHRIKRHHARLDANRGFDLVAERGMKGRALRGIDLDLGNADVTLRIHRVSPYLRYWSSLTFSIQSTSLPFSASWMAMCVMADAGEAPCQCFSPGSNQTT